MRALDSPPSAAKDPKATELLRLWATNKKLEVVINIGLYEEQGYDEAAAWGIIISDFTRHVLMVNTVEKTEISYTLLKKGHPDPLLFDPSNTRISLSQSLHSSSTAVK